MKHFHDCPFCYRAWECEYDCTIEPDLSEGDRLFGSHHTCKSIHCHIASAIDKYEQRRHERMLRALQRLTCVESS